MPETTTVARWRWVVLAAVLVPTFLARLWVVDHLPDPDSDASGHLGIARALLAHPTNVSVHWVYLPAYHYVLALLEAAGFSATAVRILNAALAALIPVFVLRYGENTRPLREESSARAVPLMAALLCAVSPLVNLLGTSAQQETLFVLLLLGAVWSIDLRRFVLGGLLLAIAAMTRYETWGAVALVVSMNLIAQISRVRSRFPALAEAARQVPLVVAMPSMVAIGAWLLAHKLSDGQWFGFLRELYRYTHLQRQGIHRPPTADLLWFPIKQPLFVFGWVVPCLFMIGLRRAWRPSYVVPLGIYLFLEAAYLCKGALGSARYYESLMPFVALGAAEGMWVIARQRFWTTSRKWVVVGSLFAIAFWRLTALTEQMYRWTWPAGAVADARTSVRTADLHSGS